MLNQRLIIRTAVAAVGALTVFTLSLADTVHVPPNQLLRVPKGVCAPTGADGADENRASRVGTRDEDLCTTQHWPLRRARKAATAAG